MVVSMACRSTSSRFCMARGVSCGRKDCFTRISFGYAPGERVAVECTYIPMQIIGVVKDYHQQALNKNYTPIMLIHKDQIGWLPQRYISVVIKSGDPRELVGQVGCYLSRLQRSLFRQ